VDSHVCDRYNLLDFCSSWCGLLLFVSILGGSVDLIANVLLCLNVTCLVGLELDALKHVSARILNSAVVTLEESLIHELLERPAVSHLEEELGKLLTLFVGKLLVLVWCNLLIPVLSIHSLGDLSKTHVKLSLYLLLCLCLGASTSCLLLSLHLLLILEPTAAKI
jgi:hypothetical protein